MAGILLTYIPFTSVFLLAPGLMIPPIPIITIIKKIGEEI
jgi:hypothetical protein